MTETVENTPQIIKTIGIEGEEVYMKLQEIVTVDGKDYALLSRVEDDTLPNDDNETDELVLMRMNASDDECTFELIEDDDEFNHVAQAISEDEEYDDEEEE